MIDFLIMISLVSGSEAVSCSLGIPVTVEYPVPDGWTVELLESSENWHVLEQDAGIVTLVPLSLDTLDLPMLGAHSDSLEELFAPPVLLVQRTMPDSVWMVSVFPSPLGIDIPPGFPENYLNQHRFWEEWKKAPPTSWLFPMLLIGVITIIAVLSWLYYRKKKKLSGTEDIHAGEKKLLSPLDEVKALIDSPAFANGDWITYYRDVDKLLRDTVFFRFKISNRALTWRQIIRLTHSEKDGRKFTEDSTELIEEITLQRYASWGGSRERAERFTSKLSSIRRDWHLR
ncbi:MAG: hypothetical protein K8R76_04160 [Candidatus Aegiribacteria sp.]|nr:hypothetical protein [Candidatus Aegiribacteria sp.]